MLAQGGGVKIGRLFGEKRSAESWQLSAFSAVSENRRIAKANQRTKARHRSQKLWRQKRLSTWRTAGIWLAAAARKCRMVKRRRLVTKGGGIESEKHRK